MNRDFLNLFKLFIRFSEPVVLLERVATKTTTSECSKSNQLVQKNENCKEVDVLVRKGN